MLSFIRPLLSIFCFLTITPFPIPRAPTLITCVHTDDHHESITLVLPEVKKGKTKIPEKEFHGLAPEECKEHLQSFHSEISQQIGEEEITVEEVKITFVSNYVPTMALLDLPGHPMTPSVQMNKTTKEILKKYLRDYNIVDLVLFLSATCDTPGEGFVGALKKIDRDVNGDGACVLLEDPIVVVTKFDEVSWNPENLCQYHARKQRNNPLLTLPNNLLFLRFSQIEDPKWENRVVEGNPEKKKDGPLWKIQEIISGEYPSTKGIKGQIFGLHNKDTTLMDSSDVKTRDQIAIEANMIKAWVDAKHVTHETAAKLGLRAFTQKIDEYILPHLQAFTKKSFDDAVALKQTIVGDEAKLGTPPGSIDNDALKAKAEKFVSDSLKPTVDEVETKIMAMWTHEMEMLTNINDGNKPGLSEGLDLARNLFISNYFLGEVESIIADMVSAPFADDKNGDLQIARFEGLREYYVEASRSEVAEHNKDFKVCLGEMFNHFEQLAWMAPGESFTS